MFGNTQEQFLAHVIGGAPNFDQIVQVEGEAAWGSRLSCLELGASQALEEGQACTGQHTLPVKVLKKIYLEEGDLDG